MNKQVIKADVPETGGPFNLCVRHGNQIYISGLPPFDADFAAKLREARARGAPLPPFPEIPFERQVRIVMDHLKKLVEAAGSNMDCLLKVIVWLKDQRQQEEFDRIYRSYFSSTDALPARTRMQAGRTPMDCGLEVEAIGYVPKKTAHRKASRKRMAARPVRRKDRLRPTRILTSRSIRTFMPPITLSRISAATR